MKIGIYFHDNDFWGTVQAFLDLIKTSNIEKVELTKERILFLWHEMALGLYIVKQNKFKYENQIDKSYFEITINDIYFNEEVDEMNKQDNNEEFFYIEL